MNLSGRTALVTGANTGIGRVTAVGLARAGATVVLACRSKARTEPVLAEIEAAMGPGHALFLELDLGSMAKVRDAAADFLATGQPLHLLVNNAGLAGTRGLTDDDFELTFGVNHLGPFLFTNLLLDHIKASAPARIVNVASTAHYAATGIDWDAVRARTKTVSGVPEYQVSKLANVLFSRELARRVAGSGVNVYALHPGVVASDVWRSVPWPVRSIMKLFMLSNEDGAKTSLHCAMSDEAGQQTGLYYDKCKPQEPSKIARDDALARELWEKSEAWCGLPASS